MIKLLPLRNAKAAGALKAALIGLLIIGAGEGARAVGTHWRVAIDWFEEPCLPSRLYLVKMGRPAHIRAGDLVAVRTDRAAPYINPDTMIGKFVAATSGDRYAVRDLRFSINDRPMGTLELCRLKHVPRYCDDRQGVVGAGQVMLYTTHTRSFDSRYWGPVPAADVVGTIVWPAFTLEGLHG